MKTIEYRHIDKSAWPRGPWDEEPDKKQWQDQETGLPCIARRNVRAGNWCGYVGVPPGHPLHGKSHEELDVGVHGGLTYSAGCDDGPEASAICHLPDAGEPDGVWWFGYDCHHYRDLAPANLAMYRMMSPPLVFGDEEYRTLAYVEAECANLAKQLRAENEVNQPVPAHQTA